MAASFSSYEQRRLKNIEENKKVLHSLGLLNGGLLPKRSPDSTNGGGHQRKQGIKRKRSSRNETESVAKPSPGFDGCYKRRWSRRLEGKEPQDYGNLDFDLEEEDEDRPIIKRPIRISENAFGAIPGIPVGTTWASRLDCSRDGVHRPTVAGIHGNEALGCYSIALSGGYEDDLDFGLAFTYTGAGGRDLKGTKANPKNLRTAPQSKDQTLVRSNLALSRNVENRLPVRVIRGYKLDSPYAPEEGYRYDGLYMVERFWQAVGLSGFVVYKFALKRCEDQGPCPWKLDVDDLMNGSSEEIRNGDGDECSTESSDGKNGESSEDRPAEAQGVSKEFEIEETSGIQENGQCTTPSLEGDEHNAGSSNGKDGESSEDRPAEVHGVSKEFEIKKTSEIQENGKCATPSSEGGEHGTENGDGKNGESSEERT